MAVERATAVGSAPIMAVVMEVDTAVDTAQDTAVDMGQDMAVDLAPIMAVATEPDMAVDMALAMAATGQFATGDVILAARTSPLAYSASEMRNLKIILLRGSVTHDLYLQEIVCVTEALTSNYPFLD